MLILCRGQGDELPAKSGTCRERAGHVKSEGIDSLASAWRHALRDTKIGGATYGDRCSHRNAARRRSLQMSGLKRFLKHLFGEWNAGNLKPQPSACR